jgi:N utilization substance protein A
VSLDVARKYREDAEIGDFMSFEIDTSTFGRIAAQTFKQVLSQKIREVEQRKVLEQFHDLVGEVVTGTVTRRDESSVLIQVNRTEVELPKREQVNGDDYRANERLRVFVLKLDEGYRGFRVIVSRSHPNLLRKLVELEVPEVAEGVVEIMSVSREPGQRSKIAVLSHDERIDAVGACVGPRGARVQAIMEELRPEKIVPETQLSLAIGRGGQNVRLAARLTDWKIDIRSDAQAAEEREAKAGAPAEKAAEE